MKKINDKVKISQHGDLVFFFLGVHQLICSIIITNPTVLWLFSDEDHRPLNILYLPLKNLVFTLKKKYIYLHSHISFGSTSVEFLSISGLQCGVGIQIYLVLTRTEKRSKLTELIYVQYIKISQPKEGYLNFRRERIKKINEFLEWREV